jgi:hypothetical protein
MSGATAVNADILLMDLIRCSPPAIPFSRRLARGSHLPREIGGPLLVVDLEGHRVEQRGLVRPFSVRRRRRDQ